MNENIENIDNAEGGEITFAAIFRFLKRAGLRILIFVVAGVVLTMAVMLPIAFARQSNYSARVRVELLFKGIDQGRDPRGSIYDKESMRNISVIDAAIESAGLSDKLTDVDTVRSSISVTAVLSPEYTKLLADAAAGDETAKETLLTYVYNPSRYDIQINNPDQLGLSQQQAKTLADAIFSEYQKYFNSVYDNINYFATEIYSLSSVVYDYLDYYDIYSSQLESIRSYLNELKEETAISRIGKQFKDLLTELDLININYKDFHAYVLTNGVTVNTEIMRNKLLTEEKELGFLIDEVEFKIEKAVDQLAKYKPNTTTIPGTGGDEPTVVSTYPQEYYNLQTTLTNYYSQLASLNTQLSRCKDRLVKYAEDNTSMFDSAKLAAADIKLAEIKSLSKAFVEKVNEAIADYFQSEVMLRTMRVVQPAAIVSEALTPMPYIPVLVVVAVVAIAAACIVTQVKIVRARKNPAKNDGTDVVA